MTESQDERMGLPSASQWRRLELCPGSWQLEGEARKLGQLAHEQESPEARRGTLIHQWLAGIADEDGRELVLSEDERQTAEFLLERASEQRSRIFSDAKTLQLEEKRLWLVVNGQKLASGKFDRCIYSVDGKLALIQDFKSGQSEPVEAEISQQMLVLAVLVGLALPSVQEIVVQVISVFFGVSERRFYIKDLAQAYRDVLKTLRAIKEPDAPLVPGHEQCRFCGALNICEKVKELANPITVLQISALPGGTQGAQILDKVEVLQEHLDTIREYYAEQLTKNPAYQLPGYAMVPGYEVRTVKDWKTARMRLAEFLPDDQIEKAGSYGITKIQSALAKELKLTPVLAEAKFNQILEGLIEMKQNKSSLKRVSRPKLVVVNLP